MKKIKRIIVDAYHDQQLNEIKEKMDLTVGNSVFPTKKRLVITSFASLATAFVVLIIAVVISFKPKNEEKTDGNDDYKPTFNINEYMEKNTANYIKTPIESVIDGDGKLEIAIYYGITHDDNHLIFIFYQSEESIEIDTIIYDNETFAGEELHWSNSNSNLGLSDSFDYSKNIFDFEVNSTNLVTIEFHYNNKNHELEIDLSTYYEFLKD